MNKKILLMSPVSKEICEYFSSDYEVIYTDRLSDMINFEQYHADMQMLNIHGNIFVNEKSVGIIAYLNSKNIKYTECENIKGKYPENIALNAVLVGNKLLCREDKLHYKVREYCNNNSIEIINVKQGYAKCSTIVLDENSIITDDKSIAKASAHNGIETLLIDKDNIILDTEHIGFIGGCSTKIGKTVYFFGDIKKHNSYKQIKDYLAKKELSHICAISGNLIDIGGIIEIN